MLASARRGRGRMLSTMRAVQGQLFRCSVSVADACRFLFRNINCLTGEQIALEWLTIERMLFSLSLSLSFFFSKRFPQKKFLL